MYGPGSPRRAWGQDILELLRNFGEKVGLNCDRAFDGEEAVVGGGVPGEALGVGGGVLGRRDGGGRLGGKAGTERCEGGRADR